MLARLSALFLLSCSWLPARAGEDEWFFPLGPPPKAAPQRISGGESFPPLPLPATPLRRSERKREPSPPKLVGKVIWGESATFEYEGGTKTDIADWNLCPADLQELLAKVRQSPLEAAYGFETVDLATFHGDPERLPVLFLSGTRTLRFTPEQAALLKAYAMKGGTILADNVAGSPFFDASVRTLAAAAFPGEALRPVPADHPLLHVIYDVVKVSCPKKADIVAPALEGIYVGCRFALLYSRYGLGCGWDNREVPFIKKAVYYDVDSASRLGVNLIAYALGYAQVGREEAAPELYGSLEARAPTDEFVFAQIVHDGAWNAHPGAAGSLLRRLRRDTSLRVSLKRVGVLPGRDDLSAFPFLYLTGLDHFEFSDPARAALRDFLAASGTLLVNNALGLSAFDGAARSEIEKIAPGRKLEEIPADHPIYRGAFNITRSDYLPGANPPDGTPTRPYLLGVRVAGEFRVIYSPLDLEAGWGGCEHPLCRGFAPASAQELGVNLVLYAMTH